jgi:hypothetical protein
MYVYLPNGRQKKNGNQHKTNTPTTIPNVFAAFFSRLNFAILFAMFCLKFGRDEKYITWSECPFVLHGTLWTTP